MEFKILKLLIILGSIIFCYTTTVRNDAISSDEETALNNSTSSLIDDISFDNDNNTSNTESINENVINEVDETNSTAEIIPLVKDNPNHVENNEKNDKRPNKNNSESTSTMETIESTTTAADSETTENVQKRIKKEETKEERSKVPLPQNALEKLKEEREKFKNTADIIQSKIKNQKEQNQDPPKREVSSEGNSASIPRVIDSRIDPRNNGIPFRDTVIKAVDEPQTTTTQTTTGVSATVTEITKGNEAVDIKVANNNEKVNTENNPSTVEEKDTTAAAPEKEKSEDTVVSLNAATVSSDEKVDVNNNGDDFYKTVTLPPLKIKPNGTSNSQNVHVVGDKANATVSRTLNSISVEAHNIL